MPRKLTPIAQSLRRNATSAGRRLWRGLRRGSSRAFDFGNRSSLVAQGFAILRFTNDEVLCNLAGVLDTVWARLIELRPRIEDGVN
jgi:very-short-patch-repair endonuclease